MKTVANILATLAIVTLLVVALLNYADRPTVYVDAATGNPTACITAETNRVESIQTPTCKAVLAGTYDEVPVAAGWQP